MRLGGGGWYSCGLLDEVWRDLCGVWLVCTCNAHASPRLGAKLISWKLGWEYADPSTERHGTRAETRAINDMEGYDREYASLLGLNLLDLELYRRAKSQFRREVADYLLWLRDQLQFVTPGTSQRGELERMFEGTSKEFHEMVSQEYTEVAD